MVGFTNDRPYGDVRGGFALGEKTERIDGDRHFRMDSNTAAQGPRVQGHRSCVRHP